MQIAIIDDVPQERARLAEKISLFCNDGHVAAQVDTFEGGAAFLPDFEPERYDLIFLDIYMDGLSGMEIAEKIRAQDKACLLVFCTTSREHAVTSYRVRAFDYLVKPYTDEQLYEVMRLCVSTLRNRSRYIEVKEGWSYVKILLRDIIYTDYSNHYIQIHTTRDLIKTHMTFADFAALLLQYPNFLCCYRNCIINMDEVSDMEERDFYMSNGERVPIARAERSSLRQRYANYAFEKLNGGV